MNNKKKFEFKISCGITSILMIFVILSLTAFGVLSYTAAATDMKMSEKNAKSIEEYYAAESRVVEKISRIDGICYNAKKNSDMTTNFNQIIKEGLEKESDIEKFDENTGEITLKESIGEGRYLLVKIEICDIDDEKNYKIKEYRTIREN